MREARKDLLALRAAKNERTKLKVAQIVLKRFCRLFNFAFCFSLIFVFRGERVWRLACRAFRKYVQLGRIQACIEQTINIWKKKLYAKLPPIYGAASEVLICQVYEVSKGEGDSRDPNLDRNFRQF